MQSFPRGAGARAISGERVAFQSKHGTQSSEVALPVAEPLASVVGARSSRDAHRREGGLDTADTMHTLLNSLIREQSLHCSNKPYLVDSRFCRRVHLLLCLSDETRGWTSDSQISSFRFRLTFTTQNRGPFYPALPVLSPFYISRFPEVTQYGWQDIKIQELTNSYSTKSRSICLIGVYLSFIRNHIFRWGWLFHFCHTSGDAFKLVQTPKTALFGMMMQSCLPPSIPSFPPPPLQNENIGRGVGFGALFMPQRPT